MANFDINVAGFAIAGLFLVVWAAALLYWRLGHVEARWTSGTVVPDSGQESGPHVPSAAAAPYRRNRPAEGPGG
jgi:high-affinity nickel-transport protein